MIFNIDKRYLNAVQNFEFVQLSIDSHLPIQPKELDKLISEVAKAISANSDLREYFSSQQKENLSLHEVYYFSARVLDEKYESDTPILIEESSDEERLVLSHAYAKLQSFVKITPEDLKAEVLLFGMRRVHEFVTNEIISKSNCASSDLENKVFGEELIRLKAIRNKYPENLSEGISESEKQLIADIDKDIAFYTGLLTEFQLSAMISEKFTEEQIALETVNKRFSFCILC